MGRRAVSQFDREDLEQEGLMACWRAPPHFNPDRASLRTFIECVIARRMTSLHRARCCRPRLQPLDDNDGYHVGNAWARNIEVRSDVQHVLDGVPEFDRAVALCLREYSVVDTGRHLRVSRSTVYRAIERLRVAFISAGLSAGAAL